jgi:5,10-methenyltetrahydrofolate synthetase
MNRTTQRATLIAARRAIDAQQRKLWDKQIADQVVAWCKANAIKTVGIYSPIQAEPSLHEILPILSELGINLALPSAPAKDQALTFSLFKQGDELMKDRYGVLVPLETAPTVEPEVIFIPCVGFTEKGYRLGYGGGFYDRTLAKKPKPKAIGIAYRISMCEMEVASHDIAMDSMITDY